MANINVSYEQMNAAADRLTSGREALELQLDELRRLIEELTNNGFVTDQASGAYFESYTQFNTGAVQTVSGLNGLSAYLRTASTTLGDTDASLAAGARA